MLSILIVLGWRFFFYMNEGNDPIHVHARKGEAECKYCRLALRFSDSSNIYLLASKVA